MKAQGRKEPNDEEEYASRVELQEPERHSIWKMAVKQLSYRRHERQRVFDKKSFTTRARTLLSKALGEPVCALAPFDRVCRVVTLSSTADARRAPVSGQEGRDGGGHNSGLTSAMASNSAVGTMIAGST